MYDPILHDPQIEAQLSKYPITRDTATFFSNETPSNQDNTDPPPQPPSTSQPKLRSCGWTAIRFKANNPGAWFMHCHYSAHMIMGMQLVMNELPLHQPSQSSSELLEITPK
ncbi:hypothetical protein DSO57_1015049 [Entomophthora muscae]|uniref:Uncharacterized protein n=1 Tax=Entomophthora muscae TaxID=34485 RepID=A0ACC2TSX1_9FUNG|nr:hypothetical protein DSO57_1015049 [Entomophthora muscae]